MKSHRSKNVILKIWGFNYEKFKTAWEKYANDTEYIGGLYLSLSLFSDTICKYISRKKQKSAFYQKKVDQ
jgi:hypothetical protein